MTAHTTLATDVEFDQQRLLMAWRVGQRRARALGRPVLVSVALRWADGDPLALFAAATTHDRFFWEVPSEGASLAAAGRAWSSALGGADRFAEASAEWRALLEGAHLDLDIEAAGVGPVAMAGFAFDPQRPATPLWAGFPAGLLVLPRVTLTRRAEGSFLTLNAMVGPEGRAEDELAASLPRLRPLLARRELPPARRDGGLAVEEALAAAEWQAIVAGAVGRLRAGELEKVVLAREVRVRSEAPIAHGAVLDALRASYPSTFVFGVGRGERVFLGASPERLVRLRGGEVAVTALAGSIARGATPEEDRRLGEELLASAKDREEHAIVVRTIRRALAGVCESITAPAEPSLLAFRNVQHLFTPVTARITGERTLLDLAARLHPTPAVGGQPREAAMALIREVERLDRGWYAAPVGWIDARGDGELAVALRSALLGRHEGSLFAGCGIVADSDPAREYAESQLKLRPILGALAGGR